MVCLSPLLGGPAEAGEPSRTQLVHQVLGSGRASPGGDTARLGVRISGATPGVPITIYEQLGSDLELLENPQSCVITVLPIENLPGADPAAPAENRVACAVTTDGQGNAMLILRAQVTTRSNAQAGDATTRSVVAIEGDTVVRIGPTASAQIEVLAEPCEGPARIRQR
jgi:hypothetical protein